MKRTSLIQIIFLAISTLAVVVATSAIVPVQTIEAQTVATIEKGVICAEAALKYSANEDLERYLGVIPVAGSRKENALVWVGTPERALRVAFIAHSITLNEYLEMIQCLPRLEGITLARELSFTSIIN